MSVIKGKIEKLIEKCNLMLHTNDTTNEQDIYPVMNYDCQQFFNGFTLNFSTLLASVDGTFMTLSNSCQ